MRQTTLRAFAGVVGILAAPVVCLGWGYDGHRMVGWIAEQHLTESARERVQDILDGESLADASTWADDIKSDRSWDWARPLHYANVDVTATTYDAERDCSESGCVVSALIQFTEVLEDPDADPEKQREAFRFVAHFVGDVHQPLHVSKAEDRGGNSIRVEVFGHRTNLHSAWDSGLINQLSKPWPAHAEELNESMTVEQIMWWSESDDFEDWANESWALALSHAYQIPADGKLGKAYLDRNMPIIEERLQMAGIRLANLLNAIYSDEPAEDSAVDQHHDDSHDD